MKVKSTKFPIQSPIITSCKIFEHFALQVDPVIEFIQPGSTPFKDSAILAPTLADPPFWWKSNFTPSKTASDILDLDDSYFVLFEDVSQMKYTYLETRSHRVNKSFIIIGK